MLTPDVIHYIDSSVLCWLATASQDGLPNVSPKEVFTYYKGDSVIIANIASPQTVKNINQNEKVCISFIDILVQKGYQLKGNAKILKGGEDDFEACEQLLLKITEGKYPFSSITRIIIEHMKPIIAPRYILYPETTEAQQIESAKSSYNL